MIDTHAHLNFKAFKNDLTEIIERCFENGMKAIINVGAKLDTSQRAIELAHKFNNLYAAVGLHPIHVVDEDLNIENYRKLTNDKSVIAIGETGLDYFHTQDVKVQNKQKKVFQQFLELAREKSLPLILHCRGSKEKPIKVYQEMLEILNPEPRAQSPKPIKGVIHCFTSTSQIAQQFLDLGFYVGFTGVITFAKELEKTVKAVPLDKILLETDCPFMSPEPFRGKRCEPWYVKFVAERIAEIKNVSFKEVIKETTQNAIKLFRI